MILDEGREFGFRHWKPGSLTRLFGVALLFSFLFFSLQQSLMSLQQDQLTELEIWLTDMEKQIEEFTTSIQRIETIENIQK